MTHLSGTLRTTALAGFLGLGFAAASPALAQHSYVRCDQDGGSCERTVCDDDGDDCRTQAVRVYTRCDQDGDRCWRMACDSDGDDCRRMDTGNYGYGRQDWRGRYDGWRWSCDEDSERCGWVRRY